MRKYPTGLLLMMLFLSISSFSFSQGNYPKTLLWRITGKDLQKPSYLFGTMHLKDARIFQFSDSLYHFLEQAEGYAMEIDPERTMELLMKSFSEPDTTGLLQESMDKQEFKKAAANLEKQFGIPAGKVTKKQAWLYKLGMGAKEEEKADDMDAAVDAYLYDIAKRQGKWVGGIEDVEDQLNILDELFSADDFNVGKAKRNSVLERLIQVYLSQDLNGIEKWMTGYDSSSKDALLIKRNGKMSRRIDSLAHVRSHFFAVGAAHLPGKEGVIQLLRALGYQVDPVFSNKKITPANYHYKAVELPWTVVKNDEETFSVQMPGKAITFTPYGDIMKMKLYIDMGTGLYYFASNMRLAGNKSVDSILLRLATNYAKNGKILKQENIVENNRKGIAILTTANGYYYQLKLFSEGDQFVLLMAGSQKKAQLAHPDVNKFYSSLNISANAATNEWYHYEDKGKAFKIAFPAKPSSYDQLNQQMKQKDGAAFWDISNLTYIDPISQAFYMMVLKEAKPGYFINSDKQLFEDAKANMESNPDFTVTKYGTGLTDNKFGYFWVDGKGKSNNYNIRSYHVSRGNKYFSLAVVYDPAVADTTQVSRYFQSLKLLNYAESPWQKYSDSLYSFSVMAPSAFTTNTDSTTQHSRSIAFDEKSGSSFFVDKQIFSPYYWAENDSLLYANVIKGLVSYEDSLLFEKEVTFDGLQGREFQIRLTDQGRNFKHGLVLLNGDTLYTLYTIQPAAETLNDYTKFFTSFKVEHHATTSNLFVNKAGKLLNDFSSADSITFEKASDAFDYAPFTKQDLPYLHAALLKPLADFDDHAYAMHDRLEEKVLSLADSTSVDFIANNYSKVEREELKYPLLNILAGIKTKESYDLLKRLLKDHRPVKGNVNGLGYKLTDSLLLSKSLVPDLLPLFSDTLFANALPGVVNELLDSNLLTLSALELYHSDIITECKRLSAQYEKSEGNTAWSIADWIRLVARLKAKESMPLIKQIAKSSFTYVSYEAVLALLVNNQTVDPIVLNKLAADKYYRADLYTALKKWKKVSLFPVKYANQQSIAQSLLASYASDDYEPNRIDFITTKQTTYKGKLATFYLYKVVFAYDDESSETHLGIVGPFDAKDLKGEADLIRMSAEAFDAKSLNKQFTSLVTKSSEE